MPFNEQTTYYTLLPAKHENLQTVLDDGATLAVQRRHFR